MSFTQIYVRISDEEDFRLLDETPIRWNSGDKPSNFIPNHIKYVVFSGEEDELFRSLESSCYKKMQFRSNEDYLPLLSPEIQVVAFNSVYDFLECVNSDDYSYDIQDCQQDVLSLL